MVSRGGRSDGYPRGSTADRETEPVRHARYVSKSSERERQCEFYLAIMVRDGVCRCVRVCVPVCVSVCNAAI